MAGRVKNDGASRRRPNVLVIDVGGTNMKILATGKHTPRTLQADHVVLGGGNARRLKRLPKDVRLGDNAHAFLGGFRLWQDERSACIVWKSRGM